MVDLSTALEPARDARPDVLEDVSVWYRDGKRFVSCFCGLDVVRSIVPHLKLEHPDVWERWVANFVHLRAGGFPLKRIMRLYRAGNGPLLFSWTVVDRAVRNAVESGKAIFAPVPIKNIERWEPDDFRLSEGTIWNFPRRGNWAVHSSDYRGNWPPQLVRNLIHRYTAPGDLIVDAFVGGGTTLIESWLCGRKSIGIDISKLALQVSQAKVMEMEELALDDIRVCLLDEFRPIVLYGDALQLEQIVQENGIEPGTVKLVCAHPPYLDSLNFTQDNDKDLSRIKEPSLFYEKMSVFASNAFRVLASDGICALLIGDVRKAGRFVALGINSAMVFQRQGFNVDSVIVKTQNWDRSAEFYRGRQGSSFLLEHEYLFILSK